MPDARKCACASHVAKIAEFFQVGDNGDGGGGDTSRRGARGDGRGVFLTGLAPRAWT